MRNYATVVVALAVVTACSGQPASEQSSGGTPAHPRQAGGSAALLDGDQVARARQLAASYDYDGARKALAGQNSDAAKAERAAVERAAASAKPFADNSTVSHIFYHSLVVDSSRAFHAPQGKAPGYKEYMVTMREFKAQLAQLHERGYVLVHPQRIAGVGKDGRMAYRPIVLPPGKKPLVLSIDDVSYYEYMKGDGFATDLTIAKDGRVVNTYVDARGVSHQGSYDVSPIIDDFVRAHPDFSYRGDKGTIALTGYNGILGYRSSYAAYGRNAKTEKERETAKRVAAAMKKDGWHFASHTYGHMNVTNASLAALKADSKLWAEEVKPLIGPTDEMIFAFGADISGVEPYSRSNAKYTYLHDVEGFRYFANVDGSTTHWIQMTGDSFRQGRFNIDGITLARGMKSAKSPVNTFFDTRSVIDPARDEPDRPGEK